MHADDVCRRTRPSTPPYTPTRLLTSTPQHPLATNQRSVRRHRYRQHCTFQHPTLLLPTLINHNHQPQGVSHRGSTVKKSYQRPAQVSVTPILFCFLFLPFVSVVSVSLCVSFSLLGSGFPIPRLVLRPSRPGAGPLSPRLIPRIRPDPLFPSCVYTLAFLFGLLHRFPCYPSSLHLAVRLV